MKQFILTISLLLSLFCNAQIANQHLAFMGIPINGSSEIFLQQLKDKGFTEISQFESSYRLFGKFANELVELTVLAAPRTNTVCKVIVYFPEKDEWKDLRNDYFAKKKLYSSKYLLTDEFEFFSNPYDEGDGYELVAVKRGKCNFCSFYKADGGHIYIEICEKGCIKVNYEDDINIKVGKRELESNALDDI